MKQLYDKAMKGLLYLLPLLPLGCGQSDQQTFRRSYEEITTSRDALTEILLVEGAIKGPFTFHSSTSFRQDAVPYYWVETEKGRSEFLNEVEPLPFSKNPDFHYLLGVYLNKSDDVLFVLKKHTRTASTSESSSGEQ